MMAYENKSNKNFVQRQSNMELLRIVAMFLVLIAHVNFFSIGTPTYDLLITSPGETFFRFFFEILSFGCVNIFVLISGWFGIHPNIKSFMKFIFQCLFFSVGIYIVCLLLGGADLSIKGVIKESIKSFTLEYWFVLSYIGLYLFSPILNSFIESKGKYPLKMFLILFFLFQTIYSWITGQAADFNNGYSVISFIGLYLLARYIKLYPNKFTLLSPKLDLTIFLILVLIQTIISFVSLKYTIPGYFRIFSYVNPLLIISCIFLLLFFSKLRIQNNFINLVARSCFAVYLLHQHFLLRPYFITSVRKIYAQGTGFKFLFHISVFICVVFVISILLDQLRIILWNKFLKGYINRNK